MKRPRIIPMLLMDSDNLIKTIQFRKPRYIGDPINAIKIFNEKEVDELAVIDRSAHIKGINFGLLINMANEAFMPLSYGGGINNVDDALKLINIGFEKVIFNAVTFKNIELINSVSNILGSQSVVVSIDYKKDLFGRYNCYINKGKINTKKDALIHIQEVIKKGAGELILTSINHEGKMEGFEFSLLEKVHHIVQIPILLNGGAGNINDLKNALDNGASAVSASSMFIYYGSLKGILINFPSEDILIQEGVYNAAL